MKSSNLPLQRSLLSSALALALAACGGTSDAGAQRVAAATPAPANPVADTSRDEAAMVDEIAATLQACSYDGSPVAFSASRMQMGVNADGRDVVAEIMRFTGLPPNFEVVEHAEVPNAAAVIVVGEDNVPKRLIAYNPGFMNDVRRATADNNWAPISIMAHEIGHHLSGHTITPGGSQPPIELEADKFSGFVLYKMGAVLADAQTALNTLVPETDGATHPGRGKRVRAIEEGWKQACAQQSDQCDGLIAAGGRTAAPATPTAAPVAPAPVPASHVADNRPVPAPLPTQTASAAAPEPRIGEPLLRAAGQVDVLPVPDKDAIPAKFDRFVYDELGLLDPAVRAHHEKALYDHAQKHGIEIVSLLVKDLHGMTATEYAYAMLRQLRVGKLDVGNGAVLVVAPNEAEVGIAMGPGVMLEMKDYLDLDTRRLQTFLDGSNSCFDTCSSAWTDSFFGAANHIREDTDWDWTIRYQSLGEMLAVYVKDAEDRAATGRRYDPETDPTWRKIARIEATVVNLDAPVGDKAVFVLEAKKNDVGKAVHARSADGRNIVFYVDPHTEGMMSAGALVEGKTYAFIAREDSLSQNPEDSISFSLLSYDLRN